MNRSVLGHIAALTAVAAFVLSGSSYATLAGVLSPMEIIMAGMACCIVLLNFICPARMRLRSIWQNFRFIFAAFLGIAAFFFFEYMALCYTNRTTLSFLLTLAPFVCVCLTYMSGKAGKAPSRFIIGFLFSAAGNFLVGLLYGGSIVISMLGCMYSLGAAFCLGAFFVSFRDILRMGSAIQVTRRMMLWGLLMLIPLCYIMPFDHMSYVALLDIPVLVNFAFVGVVVPCVCYCAFGYAVKVMGSVRASGYLYTAPVITVLIYTLSGGVAVSAAVLLGVIITMIGITLSVKS